MRRERALAYAYSHQVFQLSESVERYKLKSEQIHISMWLV